jgi:enamine deaminase RidA (YjgF/YER057c/UK114 family)
MEIVTGRPPFAWAETVQYSQSVAAGDLVFTAGQGGFDDDGNVVEGGFEAQVRLLIDGMLFEMDAVAVRGGVRRAQ